MLVKKIPRGHGQRICIGDDVVIEVKRAREGSITVAIQAPKLMQITTETSTDSNAVET